MFSTEDLIDIFKKGTINDICLGNSQSMRQAVNMMMFHICAVLFSRYSPIDEKNLAWVNGNRGYERYFKNEENLYLVFHGTAFKRLLNFRSLNSLLSNFKLSQRLGILCHALAIYLKNKKKIDSFHYWIEFYFIFRMMSKSNVNRIVTASIYDRQMTWIAYFASYFSMELEIYQHGVICQEKIEHKIYCTKVYAFNENQVQLFKDYVVKNDTCEFILKKLDSVINFSEYKDKDQILIGIATQRNPLIIDQIIKQLLSIQEEIKIILMLHPNEMKNAYKEYQNIDRIVVERHKKYFNIDILISQNSTIVHDYLGKNFKGLIMQVDPDETLCMLEGLDGIVQLNNFDDIPKVVREYITGIKGREGYDFEK